MDLLDEVAPLVNIYTTGVMQQIEVTSFSRWGTSLPKWDKFDEGTKVNDLGKTINKHLPLLELTDEQWDQLHVARRFWVARLETADKKAFNEDTPEPAPPKNRNARHLAVTKVQVYTWKSLKMKAWAMNLNAMAMISVVSFDMYLRTCVRVLLTEPGQDLRASFFDFLTSILAQSTLDQASTPSDSASSPPRTTWANWDEPYLDEFKEKVLAWYSEPASQPISVPIDSDYLFASQKRRMQYVKEIKKIISAVEGSMAATPGATERAGPSFVDSQVHECLADLVDVRFYFYHYFTCLYLRCVYRPSSTTSTTRRPSFVVIHGRPPTSVPLARRVS